MVNFIMEYWVLISFVIGLMYQSHKALAKIVTLLNQINYSIEQLNTKTETIEKNDKEQWKEIIKNSNNINKLNLELIKLTSKEIKKHEYSNI